MSRESGHLSRVISPPSKKISGPSLGNSLLAHQHHKLTPLVRNLKRDGNFDWVSTEDMKVEWPGKGLVCRVRHRSEKLASDGALSADQITLIKIYEPPSFQQECENLLHTTRALLLGVSYSVSQRSMFVLGLRLVFES